MGDYGVEHWRTAAASNNAQWCDIVCRSHGAESRFDGDAWTSSTRTPPYYPDAVTLVPGVSVPDLLGRIDCSTGCSIKDSFASLDLTPYGFGVLFEAQWIVRPSTGLSITESDLGCDVVRDRAELSAWEAGWRGDDGPAGIFDPSLLENDSVAVLAAQVDARVVAGAVLNRSPTVVGISNFFCDPSFDDRQGWSSLVSFATSLSKPLPLVGYESGDRLTAAQSEGFASAGALRVWLFPG